jgi:hypothetical protein
MLSDRRTICRVLALAEFPVSMRDIAASARARARLYIHNRGNSFPECNDTWERSLIFIYPQERVARLDSARKRRETAPGFARF